MALIITWIPWTVLPLGFGWFIVVGLGSKYSVIVSSFLDSYFNTLFWRYSVTRTFLITAIFAIGFTGCQYLYDKRQANQQFVHSSEHFAGAGRSVPPGWVAANVVALWTWAATLLQSSNVAFKYGISGPFWWVELVRSGNMSRRSSLLLNGRYASGATIQVLLFAVLAVEIKRKWGFHILASFTYLQPVCNRGQRFSVYLFPYCLCTVKKF